MTAEEFTAKKRLLHGFEALAHNPAYAELATLFGRHQHNALTGLRNRSTSRERRDEYLQAAEDAEELLGFVEARIKGLAEELRVEPDDADGIEQEP